MKDLNKARDRGLVSARVAALVGGGQEKRVCVTCGRLFSDRRGSTRLFACGCCALVYGEPAKRDRSIGAGDRVVLVGPGKAGRLERFVRQGENVLGAVVMDGNGSTVYVRPEEIEKVLGLEVQHYGRCSHGTIFPGVAVFKTKKGGGQEDGNDGDDDITPRSDGADDGDAIQEDEEVL